MLLHLLMIGLALAWGAILVCCWLGWQLLRQNGRLLLRLDELEKRLDELEFGEDEQPKGLPAGSEAPAFELPDLAGERRSLAGFRGQPLLLIFFNPACGFCREMMPRLTADFSRGSRGNEAGASGSESESDGPMSGDRLLTSAATNEAPLPLIITTGDAEQNRQLFAEYTLDCPVLLQEKMEVAAAYQASGTPSGYLISAEGKIASGLAMGAEALLALKEGNAESGNQKAENDQNLLSPALSSIGGEGEGAREERFNNRSLARSKIKRDGLKGGTVAPDFRLPRLDGRGELALSELRGRQVLLVFSSPSCGPCNTLAPELEKFHREHTGVEVVMVSKGEPKENRAKVKEHGLTFPVLLQQQWEISRRYAMFTTPIAYLISEPGIITQDVAVGTDAILGLLAGQNGHRLALDQREMNALAASTDIGFALNAAIHPPPSTINPPSSVPPILHHQPSTIPFRPPPRLTSNPPGLIPAGGR